MTDSEIEIRKQVKGDILKMNAIIASGFMPDKGSASLRYQIILPSNFGGTITLITLVVTRKKGAAGKTANSLFFYYFSGIVSSMNNSIEIDLFQPNDFNVLFMPSSAVTGSFSIPRASFIFLLETTYDSVSFCNLSLFNGKCKMSPSFATP